KSDIHAVEGLEAILRTRGVRFNWIQDGSPEVGLIAQEVEKVFPELVITDPVTGLKAVKYQGFVAPLIEATKELYGMCKANEREIASLKEENAKLKDEIQKLRDGQAEMALRMEAIERALKARHK
ncbi:MAG: tail fiber domain-containing protein, partial [Bdellovibrionales bacterium]